MRKIKVVICTAVLSILWSIAAEAATLHLSVASSMTDAFKEIIQVFSHSHPRIQIRSNFGSSGALAKQISMGAPADLYVSANPKWMKYLLENKAIAQASERVLATNRLVFLGKSGTPVTQMEELASLKKIAIGTPQSVPVGQYGMQAMENAGIYAELKNKRKLVMAKDARQALIYADRGEVDGAFVYRTDALLVKSASILFVVSDDLHDTISYHLGLTEKGAKNAEAVLFYEFIATDEVTRILVNKGFETLK